MTLKLFCIFIALASVGCGQPQTTSSGVDQVTVPLLVEGHRPFVELTFPKPDGSTRAARFLVD
jgi:hypothetical protein